MAFRFFDNDGTATILAATQSAILTDMGGSYQDIPGASITLSVGTWLVLATFHYRNWQTGTGYAKSLHTCAITDSSNNVLTVSNYNQHVDSGAEQRSDSFNTLFAVVNVSTGTTVVKLRGASQMIAGTNFASGFRWDSGGGGPSHIKAVRVGA